MIRLTHWHARSLVGAAAAIALVAVPVQAQFGGLISRATSDASRDSNSDEGGCAKGESRSTGSRVLGGLLGSAARSAVGNTGLAQFLPVAEFADQIGSAIACRLDAKEQKQAADATLAATRSAVSDDDEDEAIDARPAIGSSASWKSDTRDDVSGTSTVVSRETPAGSDVDCITVTDVVIVKGEETRADKRMCRPQGSRRYSIVA